MASMPALSDGNRQPIPSAWEKKKKRRKEKMASIVKARGAECTPVYALVYDAPIDAPYSEIASYPVVNREKSQPTSSILSELDNGTQIKDINGWRVTMVTRVGDNVYRDDVEIYGEKNRVYNVKIKDEIYSIQKSIVRFVNKVEIKE